MPELVVVAAGFAVRGAGDPADEQRRRRGVQPGCGHVERRRHPLHPALWLLPLRHAIATHLPSLRATLHYPPIGLHRCIGLAKFIARYNWHMKAEALSNTRLSTWTRLLYHIPSMRVLCANLYYTLSDLMGADDDVDAVLFEKIRSGEYDADDPIWDNISEQVRPCAQRYILHSCTCRRK